MLSSSQRELLQQALRGGALRFGEFTLKSGRQSPYFFNAGAFNDGQALAVLAAAYVEKILGLPRPVEALFGPAYKGIPLVAAVATELYRRTGQSLPWAFNRKEAKDHGEGGWLVGAELRGRRVLILDDVLTAGTAIRQSLALLRDQGATPTAVLVILDRQEALNERATALTLLAEEEALHCEALLTLDDLLSFSGDDETLRANLPRLQAYRQRYALQK